MAVVTGKAKMLGFEFWGVIGHDGDPDPLDVAGIYRRRPTQNGRTIVRMDFYDYVITHTEAQQTNREKFADAVAYWQGLTEEEKNQYNIKARRLEMYGYNLCLREYLLSH